MGLWSLFKLLATISVVGLRTSFGVTYLPLLIFQTIFFSIFSRCCFVNCCFLQTEPLGTLEEEVLCLRLDSFKTAGNNFCGRSEDKFWRYLSLLLRHFCSGYYCTLAAKAIWDQIPFEVALECSNSKYCISLRFLTK